MVKLSEADMQPAESVQQAWLCTPPPGTKPEDVLSPKFWNHVSRKLRVMAKVAVMPKDGAWYGEFLVTYVNGLEARVEQLLFKSLEDVKPTDDSDYVVKWISPPCKFGVIRKSDKVMVKDGFEKKSDAEAWAKSNEKALKR